MSTEAGDLNKPTDRNQGTVRVCLIDYGCGNVRSVFNMIEGMGITIKISNDVKDMDEATHLILPGVGAFGEAMDKLRSRKIIGPLEENVIRKKKPFLGICVGMQILASQGTEYGQYEGLGWIPGIVERMNVGKLPLPHVGWNNLLVKRESSILKRITNEVDFYFVHSYYFKAQDQEYVDAVFDYGGKFPAVISKDNIFGTQFHPEKSQKAGKILIGNFLRLQ